MNWQDQLEILEKRKDWDDAINLMNKIIADDPHDVWKYIYTIYLFHNILLEEHYPKDKQENLERILQKYFEKSRYEFSENPEYLFFVGKILHIAEWHFGLKDNSLAIDFQKKAMKMQPGNTLYEWAYRLSCPDVVIADYLAHELISKDQKTVEWLKSKGFPGNYVLEHLQMSNERYLANKSGTRT